MRLEVSFPRDVSVNEEYFRNIFQRLENIPSKTTLVIIRVPEYGIKHEIHTEKFILHKKLTLVVNSVVNI